MDKTKILLVDDKKENLFAMESLLKSPALEFHRAESGIAALDLLLRHEFALAILDVQMPEMDGFELAELMRGTERTRSVPIIFVTAGVRDRHHTFRGYEMGAVDFLYKPLDPQIVRSKVQVFMQIAQQRRQIEAQLRETKEALQARDEALHQANEALQARDEFLSIASHELKTPLTSLYLQLQLLTRSLNKNGFPHAGNAETLSESELLLNRVLKGLETCQRQSGKLSRLLDELLDLTRVRLGRLQLEKTEVDLNLIVRDLSRRFSADSAAGAITIEGAERPIVGYWDPLRIEQVITNLLSNAVKYGSGKPIRIRTGLDAKRTGAVIEVSDQGMGIAPDLQEKIFERFERAVGGKSISGLGLGLYITRQIVEAHGGRIEVRSRLGEGATFTVRIPLRHETVDSRNGARNDSGSVRA